MKNKKRLFHNIRKLLIICGIITITYMMIPKVDVDNIFSGIFVTVFLVAMNQLAAYFFTRFGLASSEMMGLGLFIANSIFLVFAHEFIPGFKIDNLYLGMLFALILSILVTAFDSYRRSKTTSNEN